MWLGALPGRGLIDPTGKPLRRAVVRCYGDYTALQFIPGQTQSRMRTSEPDFLLIDYTRTMLGCLLWQPRPARIGMVGLGGGSQLKFCRRYLPQARVDVVENNPEVIALRSVFSIPADDAHLQVLHDDGARFLHFRRDRYDILLVDGYDETGIPAALSTRMFYDDCGASLAANGVMAVNLYCDDAGEHAAHLRCSFGEDRVLLLEEAKMSNRVAFAWIGERPDSTTQDVERALAGLDEPARVQLVDVFRRVAAALQHHPA
jgi:spermidine synthase